MYYDSDEEEEEKKKHIITRHNKLHDGVTDLSRKYFTPSQMCNGPLIHPVVAVPEGKAHPVGSLHNNLPEPT